MSNPSEGGTEIVLAALAGLLDGIRKTAGYWHSPKVVRENPPAEIEDLDPDKLPALYVYLGDEEGEFMPSNRKRTILSVMIGGIVVDRNRDSLQLTRLVQDVKRCLQASGAIEAGTWQSGHGQVELAVVRNVQQG